jgi:hypothetical protein
VVEFADEKEEREFQEYMAEQERFKEWEAAEKMTQRTEINRKIAEDKKKKKKEQDKQMSLFDGF